MPPSSPLPPFVYGTAWKEERTAALAEAAIQQGFRGIDTANQRKHYVEAAVGDAIARCIDAGAIRRDQLFLQTKFTHRRGQDDRLPYDPRATVGEQVKQSFASSLEHLHTDYLDSYVLHGPSQRPGLADQDWEAWHAMEALFAEGSIGALGVSNVSHQQLELLLEGATVKPGFVQNRCYADAGWGADTRRICREHGIVYQGFSLLTANRPVWNGEAVAKLGHKYGKTPAQIIFCLAMELQILPLTGTTNPERMAGNLGCSRGLLSGEEIGALQGILLPQPDA